MDLRDTEWPRRAILSRVARSRLDMATVRRVNRHGSFSPPLWRCRDRRGRIVGVAFSLAKLYELPIRGIKFAGDVDRFDELLGEIGIGATGRHQFVAVERRPV